MIEIDGSYGEGGGQIVRTALFLSSVLKVPVRIRRIRAGRKNGGLKRQHLWIVKVLRELCGAQVKGVKLGSEDLTFIPGRMREGSYTVDLRSAGSIGLFLQTVLPVTLFVPGRVEVCVTGGTEVPSSPTIDWIRFVYLRYLLPIPGLLKLDVLRRGYFPRGGGEVRLSVESGLKRELVGLKEIREFLKERVGPFKGLRGEVKRVHLISIAHESLRGRRVVERQVSGALEFWERTGLPRPEVYRQYVSSPSIGTSVTMWLEDEEGMVMGADSLGKRGKPAEEVGMECARKLYEDLSSGATVDRHLADHLIPWIALRGGSVRVPELTGHVITNVWVVERFLGEGVLRVEGRSVEAVV